MSKLSTTRSRTWRNVLFSDFEIEIACAEWDSSAMKCEMCFPLKSHKSAKIRPAVVWEACKRKSQSSTCPRSFQRCSFIAIHDAYYGFGSAITAYSYTDKGTDGKKVRYILRLAVKCSQNDTSYLRERSSSRWCRGLTFV